MGCGASTPQKASKPYVKLPPEALSGGGSGSLGQTPKSGGTPSSRKASRTPKTPKQLTPSCARWLKTLRESFGENAYYIPTEERGITLGQLQSVRDFMREHLSELYDTAPPEFSKTAGRPLEMMSYNLYQVSDWVIKPATRAVACGDAKTCSFVELIAKGAQTPVWYISHWWGEPVESFFACTSHHSMLRRLEAGVCYWVCAYANRQYDLDSELSYNPKESSFYRAMELSRGVVLVLNPKMDHEGAAVALQRIWVQFEEAMSWRIADERDGDFLYDIVTSNSRFTQDWRDIDTALPVMLADGLTGKDMIVDGRPYVNKRRRESGFPIEIMEAALKANILKAKASREEDKKRILNCLTHCPLDRKPLRESEAYDMTDRRLHALIATAVWPAVMDGSVSISERKLSNALAQDEWRRRLVLDFSNCGRLNDLTGLANGLAGPDDDDDDDDATGMQSLEYLKLSFDGCQGLTSLSPLSRVFETLSRLQSLHISAAKCESLVDFGRDLFQGLTKVMHFKKFSIFLSYCQGKVHLKEFLANVNSLKIVDISLVHCQRESFSVLASAIGKNANLESVTLNLSFNEDITDLTSRLHDLECLKHLELRFEGCTNITKFDVCSGFKESMPLESFVLNLAYCTHLTHPSQIGIKNLPRLKSLHRLALDFSGCPSLTGVADLKSVLLEISSLKSLEVSLASGSKYTSASSLDGHSAAQMTRHLPLAIKSYQDSSNAFMSDQRPAAADRSPLPGSFRVRGVSSSPAPSRRPSPSPVRIQLHAGTDSEPLSPPSAGGRGKSRNGSRPPSGVTGEPVSPPGRRSRVSSSGGGRVPSASPVGRRRTSPGPRRTESPRPQRNSTNPLLQVPPG